MVGGGDLVIDFSVFRLFRVWDPVFFECLSDTKNLSSLAVLVRQEWLQKGAFMWGAAEVNELRTETGHFSDLVDSSLRVSVSGTLRVASASSDLKGKKASHEGTFLHLI